jgi:hypothetical protein
MSRTSQFSSGLGLSSATSSGNGINGNSQDPQQQQLYQQYQQQISPELQGAPLNNPEEAVSEIIPSPPVSHQESLDAPKSVSNGSSTLPEEATIEEEKKETAGGNSAKKGKKKK